MEIISNKINQIATTEVCPGVINTYTYSQDVGQSDIRYRLSGSKYLKTVIRLPELITWVVLIDF